jgi:hypothetical protein
MRSRIALSVWLLAAVAGCHGVLSVDPQQDGPAADADPAQCDPIVPATADGHHNPGMDCMLCHTAAQGTSGPFTLGGTVFTDATGSAPVSGATVHVVDATGKEVAIQTAQNGNFWTTEALTFPVTTFASGCPDEIHMISEVASPGGCNSSSCHGSANRVHLP